MNGRQMCPEKAEATPCECPVGSCTLREFRRMAEPGGRARAMEEYRAKLREVAEARSRGADPRESSHRLQTLGVPLEDVQALRGELELSVALAAAKEFVAAPRSSVRFLLLMGEQGVGKTLAAAYVIREAARDIGWNTGATGTSAEPIQFVMAAELTGVSDHDKVDSARLDSMRRCRLLVVDDMGDEGGAVGRGALVRTILQRDADGRPTVITTNLKAERFRELYGAPFAERIKARGIIPNLSKEKSRRKRAP